MSHPITGHAFPHAGSGAVFTRSRDYRSVNSRGETRSLPSVRSVMTYVREAEMLKKGMTKPTPEQIEQLTLAFERFTRRFKVAEAAAAMENSLNALDVQALLFVSEHPDCTLGDVARNLQVALTTMSSSADRLVRREMIRRQRPEANRRSVALTVTPKGKEAVAGYMAGYHDACRAMLESLDAAERAEFVRLTQRIADYEG